MDKCEIIEGGVFADDRGTIRFVNDFNFKGVKRFYQVSNHERGFIRAWHGHKKEAKYIYVAKGSAWVAAINMSDHTDRTKVVLSSHAPKILYVPPGYYNGFQTLEEDTVVLFFSTTTIDESQDDDYRVQYSNFPVFEKYYR